LVLIHEFGHFIAAKKMGIYVEEFGLGIPPRIFGKRIGETIYSINLLPFGGFVRLRGEDVLENPTEQFPDPRSFASKNSVTTLDSFTGRGFHERYFWGSTFLCFSGCKWV